MKIAQKINPLKMTRTVVPSPIVHELLNKNNYEEWSLQVKTYMLAEDLWDVVEATTKPPEQEDDEVEFKAWRKSNAKALHSIQISCGVDTFSFIMGASAAKVAWDILAKELKPAKASQATGTGEISNDHTNNNPKIVEAEPENDVIKELPHEGDEDNQVNQTITDFMRRGEFDAAMGLLKLNPEAVTAIIREDETILHWAVSFKKLDIAKELVHLMRPEDLEIQDSEGLTALHRVILDIPESVELAKCMVEKNKKLLRIVLPYQKTIPLLAGKITPLIQVHCRLRGGEKMAQYLYSVTPHETLNDSERAALIIHGLMLKRFDIAWNLIQRCPESVIAKNFYGRTPLNELAGMRSAFLSGSSLNFWEQWIYDGIQIKPIEEPIPTIDDAVFINVPKSEDGNQSNKRQRHLICSDTSLFRGLVVKTFGKLLGFDRIYQMKLVHVRILKFLAHMCEVTKKKDVKELQGLEAAMFLAIKRGHVEYITHLYRANYNLRQITNEKGRNIFQFAAECRQHKVFSLLYGLHENNREWFVSWKDKSRNNMLHVVGTISSAAQINLIRGAALQMQRELQWFKEVERFAQPVDHEVINKTDEMTPRELFTKGHKDLVKEGEKAMKGTATSCTVVGALIVTIMFAAAFTVPGGNKQDTGLPMFLSQRAFITFIVSDVISLFSSTTSVMIFLGILTSRYAEDDFLKSLPTKMILGLITLFLSIATMMIAFSSALSIMLHGKSSIVILVTLLASVPVASFIWMQFPLLLELVISTYGAGVFDSKIKDWPREDPKYSVSC
ncbi:uncharacterized protein LOC125475467 [Pyrus x bretschneideri]|uniref:uncharacterized protein LOC125475467 n=1 Tax=Pyrus x bretschneideri TaxID=225117 RepID=UPI00202E0ACA|nr:uncharacterized protein LOC125475467 [Pyrus x bretschneideri]